MPINLSFVKGLWVRLPERTKLIGVAVLAFLLGTLWGGRHGTATELGRYVPVGVDGTIVQDTHTGEVWDYDAGSKSYKRRGAPVRTWF